MPDRNIYFQAGAAGLALGVIASRFFLVGSGMVVVPWAIAGLAVGLMSRSRSSAIRAGLIYGALLAVSFVVSGYSGQFNARKVGSTLALALVFGFVGAFCGVILATIGNSFRPHRPEP